MTPRISPEDVARLAELAGVRFPDEDLAAVAESLGAHCRFVEPLLSADLAGRPPALVLDPRWRE